MISRSRAFCSSRIGCWIKAHTAVSMKSERVFFCCLAHLSTAFSRSSDKVMDALTFMSSIYFCPRMLSMACTDGNGVQSTPYMLLAKIAKMLGVWGQRPRVVVVSYSSSGEEAATVPRAGRPCYEAVSAL